MKTIIRTAAIAFVAMGIVAIPVGAQTALKDDPAFDAKLHQALQTHPEYVLEALQAGQQRAREQQAAQQNAKIGAERSVVLAEGFAPVVGNPHGRIAAAELLDYACPFCKRAHTLVDQVAKENPDVRFNIVMRPVLGPGSETLARFALAAMLQNRFVEANDALYDKFGDDHQTPANDQNLREVATKAGVDFDRAKRDMTGDKVEAILAKHKAAADKMGISATPFFVTQTAAIPGAPSEIGQLNAALGIKK